MNGLGAGARESPSISYLSISINYPFEEMRDRTNCSVIITKKPTFANKYLCNLPGKRHLLTELKSVALEMGQAVCAEAAVLALGVLSAVMCTPGSSAA